MVRSAILAFVLAAVLVAATRPHYGGVLRVQLQDATQGAGPPQLGPGIPDLFTAFTITRWESGSRAAFLASPSAPGGRPFLDSIEIEMGRPVREMTIALDTGKADIIQLDPAAMRRPPATAKIWSSSPVRLVALEFSGSEDPKLREALSLAVDRAAIQRVLLQGQGDVSGSLLPQWLSGYAFLFPTTADLSKARALAGALPAASRSLTLSIDAATLRPIADRIVLNARDVGIALTIVPSGGTARLVQTRMISSDPAKALAGVAVSLGLPEPPRAFTPEALYNAERNLLDGFRVIPLFHLPDVYAVSPRVKGGPGISPLGEWRFENLWLENPRP